jgi:hypothetical protein
MKLLKLVIAAAAAAFLAASCCPDTPAPAYQPAPVQPAK